MVSATVTSANDLAQPQPRLEFGEMTAPQTVADLPWAAAPDPELVTLLARVFFTEFRSCDLDTGQLHVCQSDWIHQFSALVNRQSYSTDWNGSLEQVILWKCGTGLCQVNGLSKVSTASFQQILDGTHKPSERLIAQEALAYAGQLLSQRVNGTFVPIHDAHSWATPQAAARDPWFKTLCLRARSPGHEFYADCAPMTSPRPKRKPPNMALYLFLG